MLRECENKPKSFIYKQNNKQRYLLPFKLMIHCKTQPTHKTLRNVLIKCMALEQNIFPTSRRLCLCSQFAEVSELDEISSTICAASEKWQFRLCFRIT